MKACPVCGRLYPEDSGFCPADGQQLTSATQVPVPSDDQDPRIGQLLCSRYQIRRVVADGGMGRVYEALDMAERRALAIKVLHPDVAGDEVSVERFKREYEVSQQLPHQHIVEVIDFQPTSDGSYALVMEFLYGEELRATLKREGVLPPARVVRLLSQVAIGLDEAHSRRLVHRDLKPDNLFLCQTSDGDITKILDFGSVKDKTDNAKKLTVMGTTIGSPYYMAPEQAQGLDTLDHRADVWALGAIAYEAITGAVPFNGATGPAILLQILTQEPTPPSVAGRGKRYPVPPTLDRVLANAFKKNASVRIESVGKLADLVGAAYGLVGTHLDWASLPEKQLAQQIDAKLPELMLAQADAPADASDAFFGEQDALGGMDQAFAAARRAPGPVADAPGTTYDELPMGVPKAPASWVLPVAIGGGVLALGLVIVAWLLF